MNRHDGLERELTVWLADVATPRVPDYTNDIVRMTAGLRQRPRWAFPERWLPMRVDALERVPTPPVPWRTIGLLAMIGLLTAALVVVGVGSATRHPAPFGLAANGLIAYGLGGDIFTVDPATGTGRRSSPARRTITTPAGHWTGPVWRSCARWVTATRSSSSTAMATNPGSSPARCSRRIDYDSVKWSPDGRSIVVVYGAGVRHDRARRHRSTDGSPTCPSTTTTSLEVFWRPPDGRELLYVSRDGDALGLSIVSLDGFAARDVPLAPGTRDELRAMGWTPDGSGIVVHRRWPDGGPQRTDIIDPVTGAETVLDVAYGHVSNDGRRVAGLTTSTTSPQTVCVIDIAGGPCVPLGGPSIVGGGPHGEGMQWSPDDELDRRPTGRGGTSGPARPRPRRGRRGGEEARGRRDLATQGALTGVIAGAPERPVPGRSNGN